ncbi:putative proP effector [Escherichia coli EPECa12]|nr:putative proP effector [Escherichia coli EPECa12]
MQSPRYYRALMAGGARYDLKGQPCGEVTPQEQKEAETRLMVLNDRQKPENLVDYTTALIH